MDLKEYVRTIPDYPKPGIMFRDVTTLMGHADAFSHAVDLLVDHHRGKPFDLVAGIEARGFILGGALAHRLERGFIPVRKKGKLPWDTISEEYELEYGTDVIEIHKDAAKAGQRILMVDDLIATGGTALAAVKLLERTGAEVTACSFVIDLPDLGGTKKLEALGKPVLSLMEFEGD